MSLDKLFKFLDKVKFGYDIRHNKNRGINQ